MERSNSQSEIDILARYTTCDVSDALTKLGIYDCFIQNVSLVSPNPYSLVAAKARVCGPAYTVEFAPITDSQSIKPEYHHVDSCPKGSVIVIKTPAHLPNAVWGGIMSARASYLGIQGAVILGKVRDVLECQELGFPVFSSGFSTLGANGFAKVSSIGQSVYLNADTNWPVLVKTGDLILGDVNGCVRIPIDRVNEVAQLCSKLVMEDERVMEDIKHGKSIVNAFKEHRSK